MGDRSMRVRRRRRGWRPSGATAGLIAVVLLGLGVAGYYLFLQPKGLAALPNPAVVAPGGFRATIGANRTITVGLEVRNVADDPITLIDARVVPPAGLTVVTVTLSAPGEDNAGFALEGELPALAPVVLGTNGTDRNGVVAARLRVDCGRLAPEGELTGEQIFVTIRADDEQREEELTPPVVGGVPWLTATARRVCHDPVPTGSAEPPLPPLPETSATANPNT